MPYPNQRQEKKLLRAGFKLVAGADEAGKGSWAGPMVAAAVILDSKIKIKGIKDSKLLRAPEREKIFAEITKQSLSYGVGQVSAAEIDKIGISQANVLAITRALKNLNPQPDYILIDAVKMKYESIETNSVIDGDYKITSIAAASIVAKVTRDKIMETLDEQYPKYSFKQHKGYGTNHHFHMLNQHGICDIHRKSFRPMKDLLN